ncbi:hypothetical protein ACQKM2_38980 [Streptomyces sp. NPDC004126]|uniref:hypothetical protein n=1 Tax=Streptomyces sp. NPDC004126 TaxID=3390695 RepID=UPI003D05FB6D
MRDASHPAVGGGYFARLGADWAVLCEDRALCQVVTGWVIDGRLTDGIAAVSDSCAGSLTPEQLLAVLRPTAGGVTGALTDVVLRALLKRAAGRDRSAVLAGGDRSARPRWPDHRPGDASRRPPYHPRAGPHDRWPYP